MGEGLGDCSLGKVRVCENHDLRAIPRRDVKVLAAVVCTCNSRVQEAETSGYLGLTGQLALTNGQAP